jgi:hypothetical protein
MSSSLGSRSSAAASPGSPGCPRTAVGTSYASHAAGARATRRRRFVDDQVTVAKGVDVYEARYAESLPPEQIRALYGAEAQGRARPDRPAVQLHLRLVAA